jgi:uncharacterized protein (TIGR02265 family)
MNLRALELVAPHCDIEERLRAVPASARIRGLTFRPITAVLQKAGKIEPYYALFGPQPVSSMALYPLGDYLIRMACAAAILRSPPEVLQGMFEISLETAREYASSMLGRTLIRLLARDPYRLAQQGLAMHRQTHFYGHWELVRHGPREMEMLYRDEYEWIEHSVAGAAIGTFEAVGAKVDIVTKASDRWNGSTRVHW